MSIGFQAVKAELSRRNVDAMAPAELMNTAAMAFLNSVGASTGPLYATGLRRAAQALADAEADTGSSGRDRQGHRRRRARTRQGTARRQDDARRLDPGGGGRGRRGPPVGGAEQMWREILAAAEAGAARPVRWWRRRDARRGWASGRSATSIPARPAPSSCSARWREPSAGATLGWRDPLRSARSRASASRSRARSRGRDRPDASRKTSARERRRVDVLRPCVAEVRRRVACKRLNSRNMRARGRP